MVALVGPCHSAVPSPEHIRPTVRMAISISGDRVGSRLWITSPRTRPGGFRHRLRTTWLLFLDQTELCTSAAMVGSFMQSGAAAWAVSAKAPGPRLAKTYGTRVCNPQDPRS